jgi:hypothetical protein
MEKLGQVETSRQFYEFIGDVDVQFLTQIEIFGKQCVDSQARTDLNQNRTDFHYFLLRHLRQGKCRYFRSAALEDKLLKAFSPMTLRS